MKDNLFWQAIKHAAGKTLATAKACYKVFDLVRQASPKQRAP